MIPWIRTQLALADVGRIHVSGFSMFLATSGVGMTVGPADPGLIILSIYVGFTVNHMAFAANNIADLDVDRHDPSRQRSPLVAGATSPGAVRASIGMLIVLGVACAMAISCRAAVIFVLISVVTLAVSAYQKRGNPVLLDLAYAAIFPAVLLYGWLSVGAGQLSTSTLLAALALAVLALQMNLCGNLKDLEFDRSTRFRTIAKLTQTRVDSNGRVRASGGLIAYALLLQLLYGVSSVFVIAPNSPASFWAAFYATIVVGLFSTIALIRLLLGVDSIDRRGNMKFLWLNVCSFLLVVNVMTWQLTPGVALIALIALVAPALLRLLVARQVDRLSALS